MKTKSSAKKAAKKTLAKKTSGVALKKPRVFAISFASVYPLYVQKAEKKGRTKEEVDEIIAWLTGYRGEQLQRVIDDKVDLETFFAQAPRMNPNMELIKGVVCGVRVEDVADPLMQKIRYLDKLIDELAKGKKMESILRREGPNRQGAKSGPLVQTLIEEAKSPKGSWKAEICRREDGNFQVFLMRWTDEIVPDHGKMASFWSEVKTAVSITDSLEEARSVARELLRTHECDESTDRARAERPSLTGPADGGRK